MTPGAAMAGLEEAPAMAGRGGPAAVLPLDLEEMDLAGEGAGVFPPPPGAGGAGGGAGGGAVGGALAALGLSGRLEGAVRAGVDRAAEAAPPGVGLVAVLVRALAEAATEGERRAEEVRRDIQGARGLVEQARQEARREAEALGGELEQQRGRAEEAEAFLTGARGACERLEREAAEAARCERKLRGEQEREAERLGTELARTRESLSARVETLLEGNRRLDDALKSERARAIELEDELRAQQRHEAGSRRKAEKALAELELDRQILSDKLEVAEVRQKEMKDKMEKEKALRHKANLAHQKVAFSFQKLKELQKTQEDLQMDAKLLRRRATAATSRAGAIEGITSAVEPVPTAEATGGQGSAAAVEELLEQAVQERTRSVRQAERAVREVTGRVVAEEDREVRLALEQAPPFLRAAKVGFRLYVTRTEDLEAFTDAAQELSARYRCHANAEGEAIPAGGSILFNPSLRRMLELCHTFVLLYSDRGGETPNRRTKKALYALKTALEAGRPVIVVAREGEGPKVGSGGFTERCQQALAEDLEAWRGDLEGAWQARLCYAPPTGDGKDLGALIATAVSARVGLPDEYLAELPTALFRPADTGDGMGDAVDGRPAGTVDLLALRHRSPARLRFNLAEAQHALETAAYVLPRNPAIRHLELASFPGPSGREEDKIEKLKNILAACSLETIKLNVELPVRALQGDRIHSLALGCKAMQSADVALLGWLLRRNTSLASLSLSEGPVDPVLCSAVVAAARRHPGLREFCGVPFSLPEDLAAASAEEGGGVVDLAGRGLGVPGTQLLAEVLREGGVRARLLNLSGCGIGSGALGLLADAAEGAAAPCQVRQVLLRGNSAGPRGAAALGRLVAAGWVEGLDASAMDLGDLGLKALAKNLCRVKTLFLSSNSIGGEGVKHLAAALRKECKLLDLNLSGNFIGDTGASAVSSLLASNSLKRLNLRSNRSISDIGVKRLCDALVSNTSLVVLDLGNNQIGSRGLQNLCSVLETDGPLKSLSLERCNLRSDCMPRLGDALAGNTSLIHLAMSRNSIGDRGVFALVPGLSESGVRSLELSHNGIGNEGAKRLASVATKRRATRRKAPRIVAEGNNFKVENFGAMLQGRGVAGPTRRKKALCTSPGGPSEAQSPSPVGWGGSPSSVEAPDFGDWRRSPGGTSPGDSPIPSLDTLEFAAHD